MAIIACLLLVGVFATVSTLAGDSTPVVKITSTNLAYDAEAKLVYNVKVDGITTPVGASNLSMIFWTSDPGVDAAASAASATEYTDSAWDGGDFDAAMLSGGIAPQKMTQVIWAAAKYVADDGSVHYSNIVRYSVIEHLSAMKLNGGTDAQEGLWAAMTNYITYAQEYLNYDLSKPGELVYVKVLGGKIKGDNNTHGMYVKGSEITVVADTSNGDTFKAWRDTRYNVISGAGEEYTATLTGDSIFRATFTRPNPVKVSNSVAITARVQLPAGVVDTEGAVKAYAHNLVPVIAADTTVPVYFRVTNNSTSLPGVMSVNNVDNGAGAVSAVKSAVVDGTTYYFSHWIDEAGNKVSDAIAYSFEMGNDDVVLTAVYTETDPVTYTAASNIVLTDSKSNGGATAQKMFNDVYDGFGTKIVMDFNFSLTGVTDTTTNAYGEFQLKLSASEESLDVDTNALAFLHFAYNANNGYMIQLSDRVGGQNYHKAQFNPYIADTTELNNVHVEIELIKNANGTYSNGIIHCMINGNYVGSTPVKNVDTFLSTGDFHLMLRGNSASTGILTVNDFVVGTN